MPIGNLSQQDIASTFQQLLRVTPEGEMFDGNGLQVDKLSITASHSDSSKYAELAATASYVLNSERHINFETSSSFAELAATASYVKSTELAEHAKTASYVNELTQDLLVNGNVQAENFIGTLSGTASYALNCENVGITLTGNNGEIQYKNGDELSGVPDLTYNNSVLTAKGKFQGSFNINEIPEIPGAITSINSEGDIEYNSSPIHQSTDTEWKASTNGTIDLTVLGNNTGAGLVIPLSPPANPREGSMYLNPPTNRLFIFCNGDWKYTVLV